MNTIIGQRGPWHSLPTILSQSQIAATINRDSSCPSDDVLSTSVTTTMTSITNISTAAPDAGIPIPQTPKSNFWLARSGSHGFDDYEWGYHTDESESEFAERVEFSEAPDQSTIDDPFSDGEIDIFECELQSDDGHDDEDDCEQSDSEDSGDDGEDNDYEEIHLDECNISFGNSVRFDTAVSYIESPDFPESEDEQDEPVMTFHEMMMKHLELMGTAENEEEQENTEIAAKLIADISNRPDDYSRDMVELDKQLFIAYINGMHSSANKKYDSVLQKHVQALRDGTSQSPFLESKTVQGGYLDEVLKHVIGMFRNVVMPDEFDELVRLSGKGLAETPDRKKDALHRVECLLRDRVAEGKITVRPTELSFLAAGIVYALEHPNIYVYPRTASENSSRDACTSLSEHQKIDKPDNHD
ncbi:hypothetical protein VTN31DRAFT_5085 [Thermomyces dupontii]|uniref:uncharacterized protein n=1 Tax=Talaromyces thermophilus TaxID=28565 RepID=UPI003742AE19